MPTVPKLSDLPLAEEEDSPIQNVGLFNRAPKWAIKSATGSKPTDKYFTYDIIKNGKSVGKAKGTIINIDGDKVARVDSFNSSDKLSRDALKQLADSFRQDHPDVKTFTGQRVTGAKAKSFMDDNISEDDDNWDLFTQTLKLSLAAVAGGTAVGSDEAEAGRRNPRIIKGPGGWATSTNLSKKDDRFLYMIHKEGKPVGSVRGIIREEPESGKVAYITWIGPPEGQFHSKVQELERSGRKLSNSILLGEAVEEGALPSIKLDRHGYRAVADAFKRDFPDVDTAEGFRLSGAHAGEMQNTKFREAGMGLVAALTAAGANIEDGADKEDEGESTLDVAAGEIGSMFTQQGDIARMAGEGAERVARMLKPGEPPPADAVSAMPEGAESVGTALPADRGLGERAWERFWGTDVEDPQELTRLGSTIAGGIGGAVLGGSIAPPHPIAKGVGVVGGGLAGVVGGAAAPEATMTFLENLGALPEGSRDTMGLSPRDLQTVMEGEALLEVGTVGAFGLMRGMGRGTARLFTGPTRGSRKLAEDAARQGIALMPVQAGDRMIGRMFVNVMGRFPLFAGPIKRAGQHTLERLSAAYEKFPASIAPVASMSDIHMKVMDEVKDTAVRMNDQYTAKYNRLFDTPGIHVEPIKTADVVEDFADDVAQLVPTPAKQGAAKVKVPGRVSDLQRFAANTLMPLVKEGEVPNQTLKQMNSVLQAVDDKIATFAKKGDIEAVSMLERVRQGIQTDMRFNIRGADASRVSNELKALDVEWSQAAEELFSNAVARRLGLSPAEGVKAAIFTGSRDSVNGAISHVLRSDDPAAITDLSRILSPETFKQLTSSVLASRFREGIVRAGDGTVSINADAVSKALGLADPKSGRFLQTKEMLARSGSKMTIKDLQKLDEVAKAVQSLNIPDVSTFVARRGTIGGVKGVLGGMVPFVAGAGAGAAAGAHPITSVLVGGLAIMGVRGLSKMLANPASSRALSKVFDQEASLIVRRAAATRAVRLTANALSSDDDITDDVRDGMLTLWDYWDTEVWNRIKQDANKNANP